MPESTSSPNGLAGDFRNSWKKVLNRIAGVDGPCYRTDLPEAIEIAAQPQRRQNSAYVSICVFAEKPFTRALIDARRQQIKR